jgi:hypothetical protein
MRDFSLLLSARVPLIEIVIGCPHLIEERRYVGLRGRGKWLSGRAVPIRARKAAARNEHIDRLTGSRELHIFRASFRSGNITRPRKKKK